MPEEIMWSVIADWMIAKDSIARTRKESIKLFMDKVACEDIKQWRKWKRKGWRCRKVKITEM